MKTPDFVSFMHSALLTVAEIKAATESFDRGDANVFDVLDVIAVTVDAYRAATEARREAA